MTDHQNTKKNIAAMPESEAPIPIAKPSGDFDLNRFQSTQAPTIAGVGIALTALPVHKLSAARDFARVHPDKVAYCSVELCFVNVPIKGQPRDTLHLIDEQIAMARLPSDIVKRFSLALATKPEDHFFLCEIPTRNTDNIWTSSNLTGCELARERWVRLTSRRAEGAEGYKPEFAEDEDAFPAPKWLTQPLSEIIGVTFKDRMIVNNNHPGLLRLIGAKQQVK
jgi:hypothetical protein